MVPVVRMGQTLLESPLAPSLYCLSPPASSRRRLAQLDHSSPTPVGCLHYTASLLPSLSPPPLGLNTAFTNWLLMLFPYRLSYQGKTGCATGASAPPGWLAIFPGDLTTTFLDLQDTCATTYPRCL